MVIKMKTVKFVRDLVIEERPLLTGEDVLCYAEPRNMIPVGPCSAIHADTPIDTKVVPIYHFARRTEDFRGNTTDAHTYIAYSDKVKELIEMPIDTLKAELEYSREHAQRIETQLYKTQVENEGYEMRFNEIANSSIWKRIKFLFTRKI